MPPSIDLGLWRSRLNHALALQTQQRERWQQSIDFLRLRWFDRRMGSSDPERIEVHWVWSYFNTLVPTLYAKDPTIFVKPRQSYSTPFAQTMEEVLNYEKDELKLKDCVQRAISDTVPFGLGWVEVGYRFKPGQTKDHPEGSQASALQQFQQSAQTVVNQILGNKEQPDEMAPGQHLAEVREGHLYLKWWPAWKILFAPGYHMVREMPYLIAMEDMEPEDLAANPIYNPDAVRNVRPSRELNFKRPGEVKSPLSLISGMVGAKDRPIPMVRLYHVWDKRGKQQFTFAVGSDQVLFRQEWPYSFDEFPFIPLIFNDTPPDEMDANPYPMDDITPEKPQMVEKSLLRTSMVKARRRSAPYVLVDSDLYTPDEINLMQESEEVVIIPVKGGAKGFFPVQPVRLPDDIYKIDAIIDNDLNTVSGFNQILLAGQQQKGDTTATEVNFSAYGNNLRTNRKIDIIEDFVIEIARRMAALCWEFLDRVDISAITGKPISQEMWPDISQLSRIERQRQIIEELQFKIDAGSTQPEQIRLVEQNLWIRNVNMLAAAFPDVIDREKLLEQHLKKTGMKDVEYVIRGNSDIEQQVAQQENQYLLQNIPQMVGPNERHDIHIPIHGTAGQTGSTPALDQHIIQHDQFRMQQNPQAGKGPQKGDISSPQQAAVPELQRQGGENFADLMGQGASMQQGLGPETSMVP